MVKHWGLNCGELRVLPQSIGFQAMSDYMVVIWIGGGHFEALILSHFSSEIQCWCWCQKPTFISLVKLKQADLLLLPPSSSKEEPRWRIKTNRPAEPHGHTRRHSVPAKPEHENHGLAKMSSALGSTRTIFQSTLIWMNMWLSRRWQNSNLQWNAKETTI